MSDEKCDANRRKEGAGARGESSDGIRGFGTLEVLRMTGSISSIRSLCWSDYKFIGDSRDSSKNDGFLISGHPFSTARAVALLCS